MNIYELARQAGVSIATISRAMNPETRSKVAPETLKTIEDLAKQNRYSPNVAAKHLSKSTFKTVGVLIPHGGGIFFNDYYCNILAGVADALLESDYRFKMIMLKCGEEKKWDLYNFKTAEGIDGLIVTHWHAFFSKKQVLEEMGIPCAVISDVEKNVNAYFASGDHLQGGRLAAEYLVSKGHRNIMVFRGPDCSEDSNQRLEGFREYLESKKIPLYPNNIVGAEFREDVAYEAAEKIFKKRPNVTAVFCLNDAMAYGVLRRFREFGIRCPEDISVMGYDDEKKSALTDPPLTTVKVPLYDVAKVAAGRLLAHLNQKQQKRFAGQIELPVRLVERDSVRQEG